jgi:ParB/RepB/Spo0J family partition protein
VSEIVRAVPVAQLRESKLNPRQHFDKQGLEELAASIRTHGVLTPLLVRPSNGHFEIACGHRRYRAAKAAGLAEVPATVRDLTDMELLEILTIENLQREDVHPLEEAQGYRSLIKAGYDVQRIAERVGRSVKYVYDRMKLLELVKEGQELFFDGKITAGHAILLSRLKKADQERVIGGGEGEVAGGLFQPEGGLFDEDEPEKAEKFAGLKPVSVRELQDYIDSHVRFDAAKDADPMLFPTAAANLERAKEVAEKVVPITREYQLRPDARADERTLTERSWRRADGELDDADSFSGRKPKKSKTCDRSVLGVVVVGPGRGDAFRVCADKTCRVHWAEEIREKAARAKGGGSKASADAREKKRHDSYEAQRRREEAQRWAWKKAAPAILEALAGKLKTASVKPGSPVARLLLDVTASEVSVKERKVLDGLLPLGKKPEDLLRRMALNELAGNVFDAWYGPRDIPKLAKALGVDVAKILKASSATEVQACRKCGCTEEAACQGGCSWVEKDLCSECVPKPASDRKPKKK